MAWLRLYDSILDDPKIIMLSDRAYRLLINLWCLAKRRDGLIPDDMKVLMISLRWPAGKINDGLQALISAGLIDRVPDGYEPHDWHQHQYDSDSAAERMRKYRANVKRNALRNSDVPDTEPDTEQNRTEKKSAPKARVVSPSEPLPSWVPKEAWEAFVRMRSHIKAPLTDNAKTLTLRDLSKLRDDGHDPQTVLEESVKNSWRGLFPPKEKTNGNRGKTSRIDNAIEGARRFLGEPSGAEENDASSGESTRSGEVLAPGSHRAISHQKAISEPPLSVRNDLPREGFERSTVGLAVPTILRCVETSDGLGGRSSIQTLSREPEGVHADTGADFGAVQVVIR